MTDSFGNVVIPKIKSRFSAFMETIRAGGLGLRGETRARPRPMV